MRRTLLVARGVEPLTSHPGPPLRAVLLDADRIAWVGVNPAQAPPHDRTIDLGETWITPSFVDAHVHATATGLALMGLDLAGTDSLAACLEAVRTHAPTQDGPLLGCGWDESRWPEQRPVSAADLAAAAPGRTVLLTRVDGHSCVVDPGTLARLPLAELDGVVRDPSGAPTGVLVEQASEAAQTLVRGLLPAGRQRDARIVACRRAAALGIGSLHEMGHPGLSGLEDARAWAEGEWPVEVIVWWAALEVDVAPGLRPGGDLFLDGSIGSGTAATASGQGRLFHDDAEILAWLDTCTVRGLGAGVHAVGELAVEQAVAALEQVAERRGLAAVRRCGHRIEHAVLASRSHTRRMARLGLIASVQPAFDAHWGGDEGTYAARLGRDRARTANPLAWFAAAGVPLAFGSDSTVTPMAPWAGVRAAVGHHGGLGLDLRTALAAHTLGGRRAARQADVGQLRPGNRADLAVWDAPPSAAATRSPRCCATVVAGRAVHGDLELGPGVRHP